MTKEKRLRMAKQKLSYWEGVLTDARTDYVEACRCDNVFMDVESFYLATVDGYNTLREERKGEAIEEMKRAKERIARFQRIVL
jgi:hypothetical protein